MPEGHVTHRLADTISADFGGHIVTSTSPQGRFRDEAARITGRVLTSGEAYGKHLFVAFDGVDEKVHVHLGLAGRLQFGAGVPPAPVGAIRWRMAGDHSYADLRGPAACELLRPEEVTALLARLGPDPLRADADPEVGWQRVHRSSLSIAALLMDQRVAAGVGSKLRVSTTATNNAVRAYSSRVKGVCFAETPRMSPSNLMPPMGHLGVGQLGGGGLNHSPAPMDLFKMPQFNMEDMYSQMVLAAAANPSLVNDFYRNYMA